MPHHNVPAGDRGVADRNCLTQPAASAQPDPAKSYGYGADQWYGVITGARVHPAIVRKLSAGIAAALKSADVVQRLASEGSTPVGSTPEQFSLHIKAELAKRGKLAKDIGLVLN